MIVTIEQTCNSTKSKFSIFKNEENFDFFGPNIDVSKYNTVSVIDCYIQCDNPTVNNLVTLSTSIVDKSPGNPTQTIYQFCKTKKSSILYDKPTLKDQYKVQCFNLNESVFTFSFLKTVKKISFRLRLEFTKCHTDSARL